MATEHIKEGHYRHLQIESTTKEARPDFLFLYHISLNFTIVGLDHEVLKETNIICLPLPRRGEKPNIKEEEKSKENKETEEKKKETKEEDGKVKRRKRNFVIIKKKKKKEGEESDTDGDEPKSDRPFPRKNDIIEIVGFPSWESVKRSDVQLVDSIEGDNLIYKMDSEQKYSGGTRLFQHDADCSTQSI